MSDDIEDHEFLAQWSELPEPAIPPALLQRQRERLFARLFGEPLSLRAWLSARSRSRAEILELFVEIGRALERAHASGGAQGFACEAVTIHPCGDVQLLPSDALRPTPAADQQRFCEALCEALCDAPARTSACGALRVPAGAAMPSWIRRALERGLAQGPEPSFATMAELLAALERRH